MTLKLLQLKKGKQIDIKIKNLEIFFKPRKRRKFSVLFLSNCYILIYLADNMITAEVKFTCLILLSPLL